MSDQLEYLINGICNSCRYFVTFTLCLDIKHYIIYFKLSSAPKLCYGTTIRTVFRYASLYRFLKHRMYKIIVIEYQNMMKKPLSMKFLTSILE